MSPNQYVSDLRAERDALRAKVARVEVLVAEFDAAMWRGAARELRDALSGPTPIPAYTESEPAVTTRQGSIQGDIDGV